MDRRNQDCYFFYYSTCTKGEHCGFRHEPTALGCETMCPFWQQGKCLNQHCHLRHMELKKNRKSIPCYWETQPSGCRKPHCPFLHNAPRETHHTNDVLEKKECEPVNQGPPLDRGEWPRANYEHQQAVGHIQVLPEGDARLAAQRRNEQPSYVQQDPLVVSFEDGMRLY